uniref:Uncharacterized protein n=1 Tax=Rhizochromulina marina TaxID=1034831 RepID=A0A7S2WUA6_9STRA|mmetsp:Transcript_5955/g.17406  ORF Transcript_5955/g.17406 Transcript_5955/m.17406 type:complete len:309 (+) Transcript_5955:74-1000(+)
MPRQKGDPPATIVCYICGRPSGVHGYEFHEKACRRKYEQQQAALLPGERRPLPPKPTGFATPAPTSKQRASRLAAGGQATGRTAATAGASTGDLGDEGASESMALSLEEQNLAARKAFEDSVMIKCEFCSRSFMPDRIAIHNKSCTAERPSRRVGEHTSGMIGPFKNRNFNVPGVAGHVTGAHQAAESIDVPGSPSPLPASRRRPRTSNASPSVDTRESPILRSATPTGSTRGDHNTGEGNGLCQQVARPPRRGASPASPATFSANERGGLAAVEKRLSKLEATLFSALEEVRSLSGEVRQLRAASER